MKYLFLYFFISLFLSSPVFAAPYVTLYPSSTASEAVIPHSATLPTTCDQGSIYQDTDADSGGMTYLCESTDTWVAIGASATVPEGWFKDTKCIYIEDPTDADDFVSIWVTNGFTATITNIWCETDQTVTFDLNIDDGSPQGINGSYISCTSTPVNDTSFANSAAMADGDRLDLDIDTTSGTPTWVSICWTWTR